MFTHPDAQALYKAILADPDDDAPRLILADWFDENGAPERAEYIRLECELARDPFSDQALERRKRADALAEQLSFGRYYRNDLPEMAGTYWLDWRRGFCQQISSASVAALRRDFRRCRKAAPITHVVLRNNKPFDGLAHMPELAQIRGLEIAEAYRYLTDHSLYELFQSPHWRKLEHLSLGASRASAYLFRCIADCPACEHLRSLEVTCEEYSSNADIFNDFQPLPNLEDLTIQHATISSQEFKTYAPLLLGDKLQRLRLGHMFNHEYLQTVLDLPVALQLKQLDIVTNDWPTMQLVCESTRLQALRELNINVQYRHFTLEQWLSIADFFNYKNLYSLNLISCHAPTQFVQRLIQSPHLTQLRRFRLDGMRISDEIAKAIIETPTFQNLEHIDLNIQEVSPPLQAALKQRFPKGVEYARVCIGELVTWEKNGPPERAE